MRADRVMARGALQLPQTSVPVPVKSNTALPCGDTLHYIRSHFHFRKLLFLSASFLSLLTSFSLIFTRSLIGVPSSMKSSASTSKEPVFWRLRRAKSLSMSLTASSALLWSTKQEGCSGVTGASQMCLEHVLDFFRYLNVSHVGLDHG